MNDEKKLNTDKPVENTQAPQVDEVSEWDAVDFIDDKEELEKAREEEATPLVGDYAKDYEDMPEGAEEDEE